MIKIKINSNLGRNDWSFKGSFEELERPNEGVLSRNRRVERLQKLEEVDF